MSQKPASRISKLELLVALLVVMGSSAGLFYGSLWLLTRVYIPQGVALVAAMCASIFLPKYTTYPIINRIMRKRPRYVNRIAIARARMQERALSKLES